jgi:putative membrane protein
MKHRFITITRLGLVLIGAASLCLTSSLLAAEKEAKASEKGEKSSLSAADKKFAENAAKGGMMEVAWGKVASERGQFNGVKQFGARMVKDHSKANDELKSIAAKKGISLPSEAPSVNFKSDRAYMDMMVKDHEKDLAEFQQEAKNGSDPDLKRFAEKGSNMVSEHLALARRTLKDLKRETSDFTR